MGVRGLLALIKLIKQFPQTITTCLFSDTISKLKSYHKDRVLLPPMNR